MRYFHRHCNIVDVLLLFIVFLSPSHVRLFAASWIVQHYALLSSTISWSLPKFVSIESVVLSNHLIFCHPFSFCFQSFPASESVFYIRWPKYWSFSFSISPSNELSGLISFKIDWFDLLAVQGTLKSFLQHYSSKASIFQHSAFFMV